MFCLWFTRALINHGALKQDAWHSPILTSLNSIDRHLLADGLKPSSLHFPESTLHLRLKIIARIPMAFNRPTKFVRVDEGKIWPENLSQNVPYWLVSPPIGVIPTGWWFGTWLYDFPFSWECHYPNWRSHILQRNRPTTNQICISVYPSNQRQ